jgi:hypothetical protein
MVTCDESPNPAFCVQTVYLGIDNQLLFGIGTFLSVVSPDYRSIGLEHQELADHWEFNPILKFSNLVIFCFKTSSGPGSTGHEEGP